MELIKIENEKAILNLETSKQIAEFERSIKEIKEKEDELKQLILEEMESKKLLGIETDDLKISYVAPTDRETFDSKRFREDYSALYDDYVKLTPVKSSIRIKVK